jgi:hypothetical protein
MILLSRAFKQFTRTSLIAKVLGVLRVLVIYDTFGFNEEYGRFLIQLGPVLLISALVDYSIQERQNKTAWHFGGEYIVLLLTTIVTGVILKWLTWQYLLLLTLSFNHLVLFSLIKSRLIDDFERVSILNSLAQLMITCFLYFYNQIDILIISRILSPVLSNIFILKLMKIRFTTNLTNYFLSLLTNTTLLLFPLLRILISIFVDTKITYFEYGLTIAMTLYTIVIKNGLIIKEKILFGSKIVHSSYIFIIAAIAMKYFTNELSFNYLTSSSLFLVGVLIVVYNFENWAINKGKEMYSLPTLIIVSIASLIFFM